MKITHLIPAPPGIKAVYADIEKDSGVIVSDVVLFGAIENEGEVLVDALDYVFGQGYVPCTAQDEFLGLMTPDETLADFAEAEAMYREEVGEKTKAAN